MPRCRVGGGNETPSLRADGPAPVPGPLALAGPVPKGHAVVMSSDREARAAVARGGHRRLPPRWFVVAFWYGHRGLLRATGGRFGLWRPKPGGWGTLRLTTTGRRSGKPRRVVVGYFEDGRNLVTMAMNGWGAAEPAWWLNLQDHPDAIAQTRDGAREVHARRAQGEERERLWYRWAEIDKNLDDYAARRPTETAVVVLESRAAAEAGQVGSAAAHHDGPTQWDATAGCRRLLRGRSQPGHDGDERMG